MNDKEAAKERVTMSEINQLLRELYQEGKLDPKPNVWTRAAETVQLHCGNRGPTIPIDREFLIAILATFGREEVEAAKTAPAEVDCGILDSHDHDACYDRVCLLGGKDERQRTNRKL